MSSSWTAGRRPRAAPDESNSCRTAMATSRRRSTCSATCRPAASAFARSDTPWWSMTARWSASISRTRPARPRPRARPRCWRSCRACPTLPASGALLHERRHALPREEIRLLVQDIAGMALPPVELDIVALQRRIEPPPQVLVLHGLLVGRAPAIPLPAVNPRGNAVLHILAVGVKVDGAAAAERLEPLDRRGELHAVVGGERLAAGERLAGIAPDQDGAPTARSGIAGAGAVGEEGDAPPAHGAHP